MKAQTLFEQAYFDIGKLASEQSITAAMGNDAIDSLNNFMYEHAHLGLGYTEIETSGDDITTPNWSWRWLRYSLALELYDQYESTASQSKIELKRQKAYRTVLSAVIDPRRVYDDGAIISEQQTLIVTEDS